MWHQPHRALGHRQDRLQMPGEPQTVLWHKMPCDWYLISSVKRRSFWFSWLYSRTVVWIMSTRSICCWNFLHILVFSLWPQLISNKMLNMYIIILISQFTIRVLCSFLSFQRSNSHIITGLPLLAGGALFSRPKTALVSNTSCRITRPGRTFSARAR